MTLIERITSSPRSFMRFCLHAPLIGCREAITPSGTLLVVDQILTEESPGSSIDLQMFIMTGGKERTKGELRTLLDAAGFDLEESIPLSRGFSLARASTRP